MSSVGSTCRKRATTTTITAATVTAAAAAKRNSSALKIQINIRIWGNTDKSTDWDVLEIVRIV